MPDRVIEVRRLSYHIAGKRVLDDLSFSLDRGEFLSVIGPNGAGKTTLIRCLNRILVPGQADIHLMGRPLETFSQRELARLVSYVPQAGSRLLPYSVSEFLLMSRYAYSGPFSTPTRTDLDAVKRALAITRTEPFAQRPLETLSGGERQKAFIAAALAQSASVMLLDEPTTFLDPHHQTEILEILQDINRNEGVTVLSVTHDLNAAVSFSDRVLALKEGSKEFLGSPKDLKDTNILETLFGEPFYFIDHPTKDRWLIVPEGPK